MSWRCKQPPESQLAEACATLFSTQVPRRRDERLLPRRRPARPQVGGAARGARRRICTHHRWRPFRSGGAHREPMYSALHGALHRKPLLMRCMVYQYHAYQYHAYLYWYTMIAYTIGMHDIGTPLVCMIAWCVASLSRICMCTAAGEHSRHRCGPPRPSGGVGRRPR